MAASCIADVAAVFQTIPTAITSWAQNHASRSACSLTGRCVKVERAQAGCLKFTLGNTQPGVLWKTLTEAADFTSSGMI
ncbi:hypothetical protein MINTMi198_24050 [Mycobacterium intracellulare M.i.198]|nr:hypothetical protein MINTMi198_24050 [Mycobacterium intracellulare M.i.198]SKS03765.1 Uncharacterised protein [Mycobacteroides abscessus subsp. abscessus]